MISLLKTLQWRPIALEDKNKFLNMTQQPPEDSFPVSSYTNRCALATLALFSFLKWNMLPSASGPLHIQFPSLRVTNCLSLPGLKGFPCCGISSANTREVWTKQDKLTSLPARRTLSSAFPSLFTPVNSCSSFSSQLKCHFLQEAFPDYLG